VAGGGIVLNVATERGQNEQHDFDTAQGMIAFCIYYICLSENQTKLLFEPFGLSFEARPATQAQRGREREEPKT
jgi:hypothetical protein